MPVLTNLRPAVLICSMLIGAPALAQSAPVSRPLARPTPTISQQSSSQAATIVSWKRADAAVAAVTTALDVVSIIVPHPAVKVSAKVAAFVLPVAYAGIKEYMKSGNGWAATSEVITTAATQALSTLVIGKYGMKIFGKKPAEGVSDAIAQGQGGLIADWTVEGIQALDEYAGTDWFGNPWANDTPIADEPPSSMNPNATSTNQSFPDFSTPFEWQPAQPSTSELPWPGKGRSQEPRVNTSPDTTSDNPPGTEHAPEKRVIVPQVDEVLVTPDWSSNMAITIEKQRLMVKRMAGEPLSKEETAMLESEPPEATFTYRKSEVWKDLAAGRRHQPPLSDDYIDGAIMISILHKGWGASIGTATRSDHTDPESDGARRVLLRWIAEFRHAAAQQR